MRSYGGLAQLGERLPCKQEVSGSIPLISTILKRLTEVSAAVEASLSFFETQLCTLKTEHCYYECNYEKATVKDRLFFRVNTI